MLHQKSLMLFLLIASGGLKQDGPLRSTQKGRSTYEPLPPIDHERNWGMLFVRYILFNCPNTESDGCLVVVAGALKAPKLARSEVSCTFAILWLGRLVKVSSSVRCQDI